MGLSHLRRFVIPVALGLIALGALLISIPSQRVPKVPEHEIMVDGPDADIPLIPRGTRSLHLRNVGAERVYALHLPNTIVELGLLQNNLAVLPDDLVPKTIQRLWLADNRLAHLPRNAATWTFLEYLNLDRNHLLALPDFSATRLRWLRANNNALTALPAFPATLERLYLNNNRLPTYPANLPATLRHLSLSGNPIHEVPATLGAPLEWLDLSHTQISALPPNLAPWRTLKVLNISHCPLSEAEKDRIRAAFDRNTTTILF